MCLCSRWPCTWSLMGLWHKVNTRHVLTGYVPITSLLWTRPRNRGRLCTELICLQCLNWESTIFFYPQESFISASWWRQPLSEKSTLPGLAVSLLSLKLNGLGGLPLILSLEEDVIEFDEETTRKKIETCIDQLGKGSIKKKKVWNFPHHREEPPPLQKYGINIFFYFIYGF